MNKQLMYLTLGALGVVYGDIGTSPLYAFRECFTGPHGIELTQSNIYGALSLITWALLLIISVKYMRFVMRADNRGEGGILALMALLYEPLKQKPLAQKITIFLGLFGAALLYGDGVITPAISVLSAVEGLSLVTPVFKPYILTIAAVILVGVFSFQRHGTGKVGLIFGPLLLLWFIVLAVLGIYQIALDPVILKALNPYYAVNFFVENKAHGIIALGAIFLVVTGGEALYADMGHFGRKAISKGWFFVVLPSLLLNYFGQGSLLLHHPEAIHNPFFAMAPSSALVPLVLLATIAAIIASQALISGAFSLTRQAVQLGYLPRLKINHTSAEEIGQIYVPLVNWCLLGATLLLVMTFKTSTNLAAAYGIAVTFTMGITSILMFFIARNLWRWHIVPALTVTIAMLIVDLAFIGGNIIKIEDGGWLPLVAGALLLVIMLTWKKGRELLAARYREWSTPIHGYIKRMEGYRRTPGTAVYMTSNPDLAPLALIHNVRHNKAFHERTYLLTVLTEDVPHVAKNDRVEIGCPGGGVTQLLVRFGFMETPDITQLLSSRPELGIELGNASFILGQETLIATRDVPGMGMWREHLFALLALNAQRATRYFNLPSRDVLELGVQVEI